MNPMPSTPFRFPLVDPSGNLAQSWRSYFIELYERIAGDSGYNSTYDGTITGTVNGSNTAFTLTDEFIAGSEVVTSSTSCLTKGQHYTLTGKALVILTAPTGGTHVTIRGRKVARRPSA